MATNFPTSLDTFSNPAANDLLNSGTPHHSQHANINDAVAALEAKVGINSSAVTSSLDYLFAHLIPSQTGNSGKFLTTDGAGTLSWGGVTLLPIANGGTNATTAQGAFDNLAPSQTTNSGKVLTTNGTHTSWTNQLNSIYGAITADTDQSTITFDISVTQKHSVTLGANRTLAVSNDQDGQTFMLILTQDGTGGRTVTWFSGIKWGGGSPPTLTTTAGKTDVFTFLRISSGNYLGFSALNF